MDNNNKQNQNSNWQTITMLVVAALLTILIVGWMNSTVNARQRQELSYNEFVNMVENGKVESISVGSTIIEVKPKADDTNYSQQMKYYVVRLEGDYQFVDRILKNNVVTNRENNTSNALLLEILSYALPFLFLLFQVAFYKDTVALGQREKEGLVAYYQDLTANLDTLQGIRHDMKNIFFTMGGFVDRSEDEEMKAFYWEKIYPYSQNAIHQSELLSAAYQLPDETLRAFFYLKLSQAVQRQVPVSLSVHILPEQFQLGIDLIDLTRILGILLDNAIEETAKISKGMVEVQIAGDGETISYTIKNPITEQTKRSGVHPGQTTKGAGHGRGLLIVRQILEQYDHAVLNACIQTNKYIQSLNIDVRHNLSE